MITVFTPVYNRSDRIGNLYESLCRQTDRDFEWIVIDDGSSDNIDDVMARFISENRLDIHYFKQPNGGKHRAINRGVRAARGEFFFIVDSDDLIADSAIEWIRQKGAEIADDNSFAGISGIVVQKDGTRSLGGGKFPQIDADSISIRVKHNVKGDLAEVFKTEVLARFPFPDCEGEKFCAEGLVWNRIAKAGYKIRYFYEPIYVCEYLADGLSANNILHRHNSPEYSMLLYSETIKNKEFPWKQRIKSALLFWRFSEKSKKSMAEKARMIPALYWPFVLPGVMMRRLKK